MPLQCSIISLAVGTSQDQGQFRLKRQEEQDNVIEEVASDYAVTYDVEVDNAAEEETEADVADVNKTLKKDDEYIKWTTCDWRAIPKFTCHDCNTRLICKPMGGILKFCGDAATPHCRNGFCSAIPSDDCASEEETEG